MEVRITELALISLQEIYSFLKFRWTQKEIEVMKKDIEKFISSFDSNIIKYPFYENSKIQSTLIGKRQVTIFFRQINAHKIEIIFFSCQ